MSPKELLRLSVVVMLFSITPAAAATISEIAQYKGADRQEKLERGAQEEKELNFYTSINTNTSMPILQAFEKQYPFIKTKLTRMDSERVVNRFTTEYAAKRAVADVIDVGNFELEYLRRKGMLQSFYTPVAANFDKRLVQPDGFWVATRYSFIVLGYNTKLVKAQEAPKAYDDLIDPLWNGKITIERNYVDWFMTLMKHWGPEKGGNFFRRLGKNGIKLREGQTLIGQVLGSGDDTLATTSNNTLEPLQRKGAPVDWVNLEPVVGKTPSSGLSRNAPNPHTAMLFLDFILSKDGGQKVIQSLNNTPTHPQVPPDPPRLRDGFRSIIVDPVKYIDELDSYQKLWMDWVVNAR